MIVNADDFGMTLGVNRAVAELHAAGALASATLMAGGAAFEDAVGIARRTPSLGVGCHVVLVDGDPTSPAAEVPSLLADPLPTLDNDSRGALRATPFEFLRDLWLGRVRPLEIEREAIAQIRKIQRAGVRVTHIDTHKHLHSFTSVLRPLLLAAKACDVPAIRNPYEPDWSLRLTTAAKQAGWVREMEVRLTRTRRSAFLREVRSAGLATTDGAVGVLATGSLDERLLRRMLKAMPEGVWELVCHPGYDDADLRRQRTRLTGSREIEREALLKIVPAQSRLRPMRYGESEAGIPPTL